VSFGGNSGSDPGTFLDEVVVEDRLIDPRLAQGIAQRRQSLLDLDTATADILMDEQQRVGRRALDRFVGAGYSRHVEASSTIVKYPSLDCSYALILHGLFREENCVPATSVCSSDPISRLVGVEV